MNIYTKTAYCMLTIWTHTSNQHRQHTYTIHTVKNSSKPKTKARCCHTVSECMLSTYVLASESYFSYGDFVCSIGWYRSSLHVKGTNLRTPQWKDTSTCINTA